MVVGSLGAALPARPEPPLAVEARIALPGVFGRIDHMAADVAHSRLFVAELGNNSLDVVDFAGRRQIRRISGLARPQGVGYLAKSELVAVANGGDGSVKFFRGGTLALAGAVGLGGDADNVRIDPVTANVVVGYGNGGLAVLDPMQLRAVGDLRLGAHPEGFVIDPQSRRAYVNLPDINEIAVTDLISRRRLSGWNTAGLHGNFPIALDIAKAVVATVFRDPPKLVLIDTRTGTPVTRLDTCGDADDVFFDQRRRRIYVSCGAGLVDVFEREPAGGYAMRARIRTAAGARTSLFVPELDRLFVAAPAAAGAGAALIVLRPVP
jgi:DNA-binding beta-propeller fold protein YncE